MSVQAIVEIAKAEYKKWSTAPPEDQMQRLDAFRLSLEPHIYNYLQEHYAFEFTSCWQRYTPPKQAPNAFVIVERRSHQNLWFILRNIAWAAPHMSVYIFCSDENINYIRALLKEKAEHYNIIQVFTGNPSRTRGKKEVDNLLTNPDTYRQINANYILTAEMDAFFRRKIPDSMFQGMYWGCPWAWKPTEPGGGGVTVRHVPSMIALCARHRPNPMLDLEGESQDSWLSKHVASEATKDPAYTYPSLETRANLIMESIPSANPVAVHQFWTFLDNFLTNSDQDTQNLTAFFKNILTFSA